METSLKDFLVNHSKKQSISFHMPGHKGSSIYRQTGHGDFLDRIMDCDVTEIPGADNLFQTEGVLAEVQNKYAKLYGVKNSYLLINGTSGGIIASILASVKRGGKIIMARNCHKSVFNALTLGDIQPVYVYPRKNNEYSISAEIPVEEVARLLDENRDAEAVILPSPNYYGICSDIAGIVEEVHRRGKVLIVDQAHGAHLSFFNLWGGECMPLPAELAGADIVINSTHKTLASFTQSAVLNRNSERVSKEILEDKLQAIQSTSPSYLLMASLDINEDIISEHGERLIKEWNDNLAMFYRRAKGISGLEVMDQVEGLDRSKINFRFKDGLISGGELEKKLMEEGIFIELYTGDLVMCMTGIGNSRADYESLLEALEKIGKELSAQKYLHKEEAGGKDRIVQEGSIEAPDIEPMVYPMPKERELLPLQSAAGRICASSIIPYPPGIPFLCPGEMITQEGVDYIKKMRIAGEKVIGVTADGRIYVGL